MEKLETDIKGTFKLLSNKGFRSPIPKEHWAHCNIKGLKRQDSHLVYLEYKESINIGETCISELRFKFRDDDRFTIFLHVGDIIELNVGSTTYAEFEVEEILNPELDCTLFMSEAKVKVNEIMEGYLGKLGFNFLEHSSVIPKELIAIIEGKFIIDNDCVTLSGMNSLNLNPLRITDNEKTEWEYNESKLYIQGFLDDSDEEIEYFVVGLEFMKRIAIKLVNEFHKKNFVVLLSFSETSRIKEEIEFYGSTVIRFYQIREGTTWYTTENLNNFKHEAIIAIET